MEVCRDLPFKGRLYDSYFTDLPGGGMHGGIHNDLTPAI